MRLFALLVLTACGGRAPAPASPALPAETSPAIVQPTSQPASGPTLTCPETASGILDEWRQDCALHSAVYTHAETTRIFLVDTDEMPAWDEPVPAHLRLYEGTQLLLDEDASPDAISRLNDLFREGEWSEEPQFVLAFDEELAFPESGGLSEPLDAWMVSITTHENTSRYALELIEFPGERRFALGEHEARMGPCGEETCVLPLALERVALVGGSLIVIGVTQPFAGLGGKAVHWTVELPEELHP